MTELFSKDIQTQNRRSSKGNQLKFERNHIWYKADIYSQETRRRVLDLIMSQRRKYSYLFT